MAAKKTLNKTCYMLKTFSIRTSGEVIPFLYALGLEQYDKDSTAVVEILEKIPPYATINSISFGAESMKYSNPSSSSGIAPFYTYLRVYYSYITSEGQVSQSYGDSSSMLTYYTDTGTREVTNFEKPLTELLSSTYHQYIEMSDFSTNTKNAGLLAEVAPDRGTKYLGFRIYELASKDADFYCQNPYLKYNITLPTIKLLTADSNKGTVQGEESDNVYNIDVDSSYTIKAIPKEGYRFEKWSDGNTNATRVFTKDDLTQTDTTFTAYFVPYYTITYEANGGTGHENGPNFYDSTYGELTDNLIPTGVKNVVLPVLTKTGYTFQGWTGPNLSEPTEKVTIPLGSEGNRKYTANWTINQYQVSIVCSPEVAGTGEISLADGTLFTSAKLDYNTSLVSISAKSSKNEKYSFDHFSITKQVNTTNNPIIGQKVPAYNITYTAHFIKKKYNITAKTVVLIDGKEQNIDCARFELNNSSEFTPQYYDDVVLISFIPKAGYKFTRWKNIAGDDQYKSVLSVKVQGDRNLVAIFEKIDLQEDSIPEGTNPNSELVTNITEAIISKNIINFVNTKPMSQIGDYAFYNCKKLQLVSIPSVNNKPLGSKAFKGCENLVSLRLPIGITHIPEESFANCKNLTTLVIPGNKPTLSSIDAFLNTPFTNVLVSKYDETDSIDHTFGYIYVNDALDYENDTNWGALAGHYRNIGDFPEVNEVFKEE